MRETHLSRYQALRGRHQSKSSNESIEVKISGDLHAANPRRHKVLVTRAVCSILRPTRIRVGHRLVDQASESIEPFRTSRRPSALR